MCGRAAVTLVVLAILCPVTPFLKQISKSIVVQVKIPQHTNVTVKYPEKVQPVIFNPHPNTHPGGDNVTSCYKCGETSCVLYSCNQTEQPQNNQQPNIRTNIVIEINKKIKNDSSDSKNHTKTSTDDATVIMIKSNSTATSDSSAKAGGNNTSAASTSSASTTNTEVIATLDEGNLYGNNTNTKDILIDADSESYTNSTAHAESNADDNQSKENSTKLDPAAEPKSNNDVSENENSQATATSEAAAGPSSESNSNKNDSNKAGSEAAAGSEAIAASGTDSDSNKTHSEAAAGAGATAASDTDSTSNQTHSKAVADSEATAASEANS